jgi:hypothetical protein
VAGIGAAHRGACGIMAKTQRINMELTTLEFLGSVGGAFLTGFGAGFGGYRYLAPVTQAEITCSIRAEKGSFIKDSTIVAHYRGGRCVGITCPYIDVGAGNLCELTEKRCKFIDG